MNGIEQDTTEIEKIKDFINDKRIDDAVKIIALYLGDSTEENYINRLENIIEMLLSLHGGKVVIRFLIEQLIIDIPSLLENLSKRDSVLRYSFLLLLKSICENEYDLFLPYSEDLLNSDDPNVREANLQLLIFIAGGDYKIEQEEIIKTIALKLTDEKDFVVEKAIQALKAIGKNSPMIVTKIITNYAKELPESEESEDLKKKLDIILKSIISVETVEEIEEIVEEEIEEKKEIPEEEIEPEEKPSIEKLSEEFAKKEVETLDKEMELIDKEMQIREKDIELKKKMLQLEEKEKEIEEKELQEKERALKMREELLEKDTKLVELTQVELELKQKTIEEKEQQIKDQEAIRAEERLKEMEKKESDENQP